MRGGSFFVLYLRRDTIPNMSVPERRPDISRAAHYLKDLEQVPAIAQAMLEPTESDPTESMEALIYAGYDDLIDMFNRTSANDRMSELMPKFVELKDLLGEATLPQITELRATDYFRGMRVARGLMLEGQEHKRRRKNSELVTKAEKDHAIGAPSVDTSPDALAVGTAGHIIERTIMAHLKSMGIDTTDWVKDQALWALEDLALVRHADAETYGNDDNALFYYITMPPSSKTGGMGWRKQDQVDGAIEKYQEIESRDKAQLLEVYTDVTGEDYASDIADVAYDTALGDIIGELLGQGYIEDPDDFIAQLSIEPVDD